jgi:hypothetical protein
MTSTEATATYARSFARLNSRESIETPPPVPIGAGGIPMSGEKFTSLRDYLEVRCPVCTKGEVRCPG